MPYARNVDFPEVMPKEMPLLMASTFRAALGMLQYPARLNFPTAANALKVYHLFSDDGHRDPAYPNAIVADLHEQLRDQFSGRRPDIHLSLLEEINCSKIEYSPRPQGYKFFLSFKFVAPTGKNGHTRFHTMFLVKTNGTLSWPPSEHPAPSNVHLVVPPASIAPFPYGLPTPPHSRTVTPSPIDERRTIIREFPSDIRRNWLRLILARTPKKFVKLEVNVIRENFKRMQPCGLLLNLCSPKPPSNQRIDEIFDIVEKAIIEGSTDLFQ